MQQSNSTVENPEKLQLDWTPFRPCPYCACDNIRTLVVTENIVQGDGGGGITDQEWVSEHDLLYADCNGCNETLYQIDTAAAVLD